MISQLRSFATALILMSVSQASAQTSDAGQTAAIEPAYFEITGLSAADQLNLRANASPTGMMIGRLSQGSVVKNLGCAKVGKNRWCKVADVNNESMQGWAAARYLAETHYQEPEPLDAPVEEPSEDGSYPDIDNGGASILPE